MLLVSFQNSCMKMLNPVPRVQGGVRWVEAGVSQIRPEVSFS